MLAIRCMVLLGLLAHSSAFAGGYLGWSFGMSKAEVAAVGNPARYYSFSNGDLGSQDEPFEGGSARISFYFADGRLNRVMLIPYMGTEMQKAREAWQSVFQHIKRKCTAVEVLAVGPGAVEQEAALAAFEAEVTKLQRGQRHQMACLPMPDGLRLWASTTRLPDDSFMVAVNYGEP